MTTVTFDVICSRLPKSDVGRKNVKHRIIPKYVSTSKVRIFFQNFAKIGMFDPKSRALSTNSSKVPLQEYIV